MIKINFLDKNIQDKENEILNIRPNTEKKNTLGRSKKCQNKNKSCIYSWLFSNSSRT